MEKWQKKEQQRIESNLRKFREMEKQTAVIQPLYDNKYREWLEITKRLEKEICRFTMI